MNFLNLSNNTAFNHLISILILTVGSGLVCTMAPHFAQPSALGCVLCRSNHELYPPFVLLVDGAGSGCPAVMVLCPF